MGFFHTAATSLHRAVEWCLRHPLGRSQWVALGLWLAALAGGMVALGGHIARTANTDVESSDQAAYILVAEQNRPMLWPTGTDGIRNPLFPWLLARTAHGTQAEMFEAGKRLNLWCGALAAIALGLWAGCRLAWLPAVTFATIGGLGVIMPISTFTGAEVFYYGLFFSAWWCALGLLDRLTLRRCAIAGALAAFAYLAKPGMTLCCGSFVAVGLLRWITAGRESTATGWQGRRPLLGAALAVAVAIPIILPRAINSWQRFGDPFQNTAANCFWEENWDACMTKLWRLNPRRIDKLSPDERPSAARYLARNGWHGAWERLTNGMAKQASHVFSIEKKGLLFAQRPSPQRPVRRLFPFRGCFLLAPLVLTIGLGCVAWRRFGPAAIAPSIWFQTAFILLLTSVSFAAFSWYSPIASGPRFILTLYIPWFGSLFCAAEALRHRLAIRWIDAVYASTLLGMLGLFLAHMGIIATHPYFDSLKDTF